MLGSLTELAQIAVNDMTALEYLKKILSDLMMVYGRNDG